MMSSLANETPNNALTGAQTASAAPLFVRPVSAGIRRHKQRYSHTSLGMHKLTVCLLQPGSNYMEVTVTDEKSILVIGLEPTLIDFSGPDFAATGMDAKKVLAGLKSSEDELTRLGYRVQMRLTDFGETAEAVVLSQLKQKRFNCRPYRGRHKNDPKHLHTV